LDQLFAEFNTLAVIYGKPSKQFIADEHLLKLQNAAEKREQRFREAAEQHDQAEGAVGAVQHGIESLDVQTTSDSQQSVNLLDWGDDSAVTSAPAATQSSSGSTLALEAGFSLSPADFQQYWGSFAEAPLPNNNILCCLAALPDEQAEVEQSMAEVNVGY
jgi:hypothetical protein